MISENHLNNDSNLNKIDSLIDENKKYENEIQALKDINEKTEKINSDISSE